jgi:YegS/Rv2252/BmrU family lipid kinase
MAWPPRAGGGRSAGVLAEVQSLLDRRLGGVDVASTARGGHAIDLARDAAREGRSMVVAVGGDGTFHEVANGLLSAGVTGGPALGYVGVGTGGDFRRTLGIEHRLDAYVDAIAKGRDQTVDAGKVRYRTPAGETASRWFVNVLSAGMGGLVDQYVAESRRSLGGTATYFLASVRALAAIERGHLRCGVSLGDATHERQLDSYMFAVCNGRFFGSGMEVAPMAKLDDGRFEVVSMDAPSKMAFATSAHRIYSGRHLSMPGSQHFACDRLTVDLENPRAREVFLLDVDGEPLGGLPIDVELVPRALTVRAPAP